MRRNRHRRALRRASQQYCQYTDDGGYCCTSPSHPGVVWCEAHQTMGDRGMIPLAGYDQMDTYSRARGSLPAIWTNPLTAQASLLALNSVPALSPSIPRVPVPISLPVMQGAPVRISPPQPPVPLGVAIRGFEPFKFIVDHYGVDDWTAEIIARPVTKSTTNQRKLAEYIVSKIGIDVGDALDQISSGKDMKLTASAGVSFADIVAEISARESMWDWHPYLQVLILRSGGSADEQRAKRLNMIDALVDSADVDEGYDSLFGRAKLKIDALGLDINRLKVPPFPDLLGSPSPKDIAMDVLLGKVSELSSNPLTLAMPEPDIANMSEAIKRSKDRMDSLKTRLFCANAGASTFDKTCHDWVSSKVAVMTTIPNNLQEYIDYADQRTPEFISMFK